MTCFDANPTPESTGSLNAACVTFVLSFLGAAIPATIELNKENPSQAQLIVTTVIAAASSICAVITSPCGPIAKRWSCGIFSKRPTAEADDRSSDNSSQEDPLEMVASETHTTVIA
jgi:hypothetical protein